MPNYDDADAQPFRAGGLAFTMLVGLTLVPGCVL
jgi:hypothetical protein